MARERVPSWSAKTTAAGHVGISRRRRTTAAVTQGRVRRTTGRGARRGRDERTFRARAVRPQPWPPSHLSGRHGDRTRDCCLGHEIERTIEACNLAASSGDLDDLKYLRRNGFPWDESTWTLAATVRNNFMSRYMEQIGCPKPTTGS